IKMPPTAIPKTMNYKYMILSESDTEKYTEFITRCCAPFEYTLLWKDLLEKHFSFHGFYLVCKDEHNLIQGVLPLFKAQGVGSSRLVSTPYAIYTGPVSEKEDIKLGLINFAQDVAQKENVDYVEIREKFPYTYPSQFSSRSKVFNFSLHLSSNPEDVWKKLPKSSVRWGVKKAEKSGLTWTSGNSQNDVDNFYSLFLQTRKFRGVPAYPYHYFKGIINSFPDTAQSQVRLQLAQSLEVIMSQRLLPSPEHGMVPAAEIMLASDAIRNLIREGKPQMIDNTLATSVTMGMMPLERSLALLIDKGWVEETEAMKYTLHPDELRRLLKLRKFNK
ncbi:MAG: Pili biogenesis protein ATPase, partial [candidate division WWE3 bacterium GW2011_GWA1_41_8]